MRQILQGILSQTNLKLALILTEVVIQLFFQGLTRFLFNFGLYFYANRTTQSLLSAVIHVTEKYLRQEALGAVSLRQFLFNH